jgi:hypothetical protein
VQNPVAAKEISVPATTQNPLAPASGSSSPQSASAPVPHNSAEPISSPAAAVNDTNSAPSPVAIAEPPAPKPAPLKLQAIVYNPVRPSAIINGRTLFVGDKFADFHILAINQESATLVGKGQTNVLNLAE